MGYKKLYINGGQNIDYLYIGKSALEISEVCSEPSQWNDDTILFSKFNKDLIGGNSALIEDIVGYEVRKRKGANSYTEYVTTIKESSKGSPKVLLDYGATNNTGYTYYLCPAFDEGDSGTEFANLSTNEVQTKWDYWSLLVVNETDEKNVFYLDKLFKFELNLNVGDINNNATVSVTQNFTPYPTVQHGATNYWSGTLSSLCGFISCDDNRYIQTPNMINELKALSTDGKKKFLKDMDGNIWEIKITSPVSVSTNNEVLQRPKTVNISWAEVADASGVSIINNPDMDFTEWTLTETGLAKQYVDYIWDDDSNWDDSCVWTERY